MHISSIYLEILQKDKIISIPDFGTFYLKNQSAEIVQNSNTILPPTQKIYFQKNTAVKNDNLKNIVALKKNISPEKAAFEILIQTEFWKKKITAKENFNIDRIGEFLFKQNEINFKGDKVHSESPDFFGLEEISFQKIKETKTLPNPNVGSKNYAKPILLWIFLFVIPLVFIFYYGFQNRHFFTSKDSLDQITIKNATHRIEDKKPTFLKKIEEDSSKIKIDSLSTSN